MTEAFTYCWTDHRDNMLYVGYHKHKNSKKPYQDGYVANGLYEKDMGCRKKVNWFFEEYQKRPQDFTRQILAEGTQDDCLALETAILKAADAMHSEKFYNQTNGSEKFVLKHHTKSTRSKISKSSLGKKLSSSTKEKLRALNLGKCLSEEHKTKIGLGNTGKTLSIEAKLAVSNARKGKPLSAGHKLKLSIAHKGKTVSEETKRKMSKARKGFVFTDVIRKKISGKLKGNTNFAGHTHSSATREKLSALKKGVKRGIKK